LALGRSLSRKGRENIAQHEEGHVFVGRGQVLEWPLGSIEAIKGAHEAFSRIGGGGPPGRADRWQQLRQFGQEPSHNSVDWAVVGLGLELLEAAAHGAL
jgi:hypothetical protein